MAGSYQNTAIRSVEVMPLRVYRRVPCEHTLYILWKTHNYMEAFHLKTAIKSVATIPFDYNEGSHFKAVIMSCGKNAFRLQ
jgi:hypothetical protein